MPSFLAKVFGRKNDKSKRASADVSLLGERFEAVSPTVSPSAAKFTDELPSGKSQEKGKEKEKEAPFSLLRIKSNTPSEKVVVKKLSDAPLLSLNLPGQAFERSRELDVVFETSSRVLLSDKDIGIHRLTPTDALILIQTCSQAITTRGLESLGIMHPHWYSASPEAQRQLISLFIQSLTANKQTTTLVPTTSALSAFQSEVNFSQSPHDIAAILRWGIRHLELDGTSFGKNDDWYLSFLQSENQAGYPSAAFTDILVPRIPMPHLELLRATLDIFSSLAAHSEANSISGSKVSKMLGLWLLTNTRAEVGDSWSNFYDRWKQSGRMLEHMFLAYIRSESLTHQMPRRLLELVNKYPYEKSPSTSDGMFPRPRLTTRQYNTLYVQVRSDLPSGNSTSPIYHPLRVIIDALRSDKLDVTDSYNELWESIKAIGMTSTSPSLDGIFSDETIRFIQLYPTDTIFGNDVPSFNILLPEESKSVVDTQALASKENGKTRERPTSGLPVGQPSRTDVDNGVGIDWAQFSTSGFFDSPVAPLAETLMDKDVEVTTPPRKSSGSKKMKGRPPIPPITTSTAVHIVNPADGSKLPTKTISVSTVSVDEAFIDFWSDAFLDPISSNWPSFIIGKLNTSIPGLTIANKEIECIVIEQTFVKPKPLRTPSEAHTVSVESPKPRSLSSPIPSMRSETSKNRFTFFSSSKNKKRFSKDVKIGEMGEILTEEAEPSQQTKINKKDIAGRVAISEEPTVSQSNDVDHKVVAEVTLTSTTAVAEAIEQTEGNKTEPISTIELTPMKDATDSTPVVAAHEETAVPTFDNDTSAHELREPLVACEAVLTSSEETSDVPVVVQPSQPSETYVEEKESVITEKEELRVAKENPSIVEDEVKVPVDKEVASDIPVEVVPVEDHAELPIENQIKADLVKNDAPEEEGIHCVPGVATEEVSSTAEEISETLTSAHVEVAGETTVDLSLLTTDSPILREVSDHPVSEPSVEESPNSVVNDEEPALEQNIPKESPYVERTPTPVAEHVSDETVPADVQAPIVENNIPNTTESEGLAAQHDESGQTPVEELPAELEETFVSEPTIITLAPETIPTVLSSVTESPAQVPTEIDTRLEVIETTSVHDETPIDDADNVPVVNADADPFPVVQLGETEDAVHLPNTTSKNESELFTGEANDPHRLQHPVLDEPTSPILEEIHASVDDSKPELTVRTSSGLDTPILAESQELEETSKTSPRIEPLPEESASTDLDETIPISPVPIVSSLVEDDISKAAPHSTEPIDASSGSEGAMPSGTTPAASTLLDSVLSEAGQDKETPASDTSS